jgi:hypothetical protein
MESLPWAGALVLCVVVLCLTAVVLASIEAFPWQRRRRD